MNGQFQIGEFSPAKLFVTISAILGVLFALVTESNQHFFQHFLQWQIQTTGAVILILCTHLLLFKFAIPIRNPWWKIISSGVLGAALFSPIALMADIFLGGEQIQGPFLHALIDELLAILPPMLIAWLAMNTPWLFGFRLHQLQSDKNFSKSNKIKNEKANHPEPDFLRSTKLQNATEVLYIKSELHYLNVISSNNKELVLLSLKEAIEQLERANIKGVQSHRGYWVSETSITTAQRVGRQAEFILTNGDKVPISRKNVQHCMMISDQIAKQSKV